MKRILINATQNEEIRVALCKGNHLYDFDLENRTREQKKSNIYKGHVTRVEPSLEAVFVEYGSQRQGFLPIREISTEYLSGNPRDENIKKLIKEGDELIVQVEKEERGNKGAALSTYVSLAGRYLVLMPNNPRGGGISRQISGKLREDMKRMLGNLDLPKGMSVIIRTAGIGKTQEDLQHDLNHLLNIWQAIQEQNKKYPSPRLVHQEAGVVTRAVRDYLRDDISEIWIDNENAYVEAAGFIDAVMPKQAEKLRKYTDYEPMFSRFNIEKQIETAYQREVRLPSGGSIVIDQTEALVSIDINSAKSTKGSDVAETAYHTNLEAADEIARQLRLRDMGGLIVIDFIDMNDNKHQKEVEKRLIDATKYDRARVQFGDISKFGLMEMSRQRLRPSLEESTGYICPRCHGNGMIRDLRSLSLSIMRQIEQIALKERQGEVQAEVPTDIAAFLLNEKRDSLVYLEQDSGTRITILPHAHLESPNFKLHFNRDGFAPSSYERITDTQQQEHSDLGYDVDWQTAENERPEQQPTRQPRQNSKPNSPSKSSQNGHNSQSSQNKAQSDSANSRQAHTSQSSRRHNNESRTQSAQQSADRTATHSNNNHSDHSNEHRNQSGRNASSAASQAAATSTAAQPQAVAWLSNLFAQAPQAKVANVSSRDAAEAIEALVNTGAQSLGSLGQTDSSALSQNEAASVQTQEQSNENSGSDRQQTRQHKSDDKDRRGDDRRRRKTRKPKSSQSSKAQQRKEQRDGASSNRSQDDNDSTANNATNGSRQDSRADNKNSADKRHSERNTGNDHHSSNERQSNQRDTDSDEQTLAKRKPHSKRSSRGTFARGETLDATAKSSSAEQAKVQDAKQNSAKQSGQSRHHDNSAQANARRKQDPNEVTLQVNEAPVQLKTPEVVHLSLDDSKAPAARSSKVDKQADKQTASPKSDTQKASQTTAKENADNREKTPNLAADKNTASGKAENVKPADSNQNADNADNAVTSERKEATTDASGAFALDHDSLFAARYVTANKYGQASNDPRVVRRQQLANAQPQADDSAAATISSTPSIRGSVGAFIRATLASAEKRLADEGVIACFIAAIAEHSQQAEGAKDSTTEQNISSATVDISTFSFSNYGYDSLSADYLQRFAAMTSATSQVAVEQGKTSEAPRPITQRASNDPRGQHPDYQGATKQATLTVPEVTGDTSEVDADDVEAAALSREAQAENISAESEQLLQEEQALASKDAQKQSTAAEVATADSETAAADNAGAEKSKTTIASYKNMIENVAEQLLPQTGMFNLTTPKVPKARTRKPKTEHKKPTQAEKAEAEHDNKPADS
ncbi:Rne/Rng family ribonuclease [Psychrobacter sp. Ps3]|uniref:Rne/Rng family ribonuclease n=1 Tax=Psychrobacter sp. Ps3 TaxID=2790957 RepID=UPI001EDFB78B|nr:Rne/Rng family ribonuclease [Psychrobacter sp. Ps3]MCG3880904.1 Rne/Rng family ribonuclease [Psychrobacter sp. Ps3]